MREVKWQIEERIILVHTAGHLSIDDVRLNNQEIKALLDTGQAPIHLIFYAPALKSSPTNIQEIKNSLDFLRHPNLGWVISVGTNPLINFASSIMTNLFKINFRQASSLDEAIETLKRLDFSLASN